MFGKMKFVVGLLFLTLLFLYACASKQGSGYVFPSIHPEELEPGRPVCSDCHEESDRIVYSRFNHTVTFADNHRLLAYQYEQACNMCHQQRFCDDCHGVRLEEKPSDRNRTSTFRRTPHRGDYLARHRIDGRVDPTSCFRCHGNPKTAETCAPCHG
jgi:hypothetical protein